MFPNAITNRTKSVEFVIISLQITENPYFFCAINIRGIWFEL